MMSHPKIFVLADDLSGAAEIGGKAFKHGLSVKILTDASRLREYSDDNVVIVDSNSRNLMPETAYQKIRNLISSIDLSGYDLIYKKVDSVLRGPVVSEINAFLDCSAMDCSVLIPANPTMERTISGGKYYIGGVLINKTWFFNDPEYPRLSQFLKDLITDFSDDVVLFKPGDTLPEKYRILLPEITSYEDLKEMVTGLPDQGMLYVGASDFFDELLATKMNLSVRNETPDPDFHSLNHFIIGSITESSRNLISFLSGKNYLLFNLPAMAIDNPEAYKDWISEVERKIEKGFPVAISGPEVQIEDPAGIDLITVRLADAAKRIVEKSALKCHVMIEGGKTASLFFRNLGINGLQIIHAYETGAVTLNSDSAELIVSIKPGSYVWPESILNNLSPGSVLRGNGI